MAVDSEIASKIREALAARVKRKPESVELQHRLREDLGLDSLDTIELLFMIEEAFDLQIPDQDLQGLATVADVTAYIEQKLSGTAPASIAPPSVAMGALAPAVSAVKPATPAVETRAAAKLVRVAGAAKPTKPAAKRAPAKKVKSRRI